MQAPPLIEKRNPSVKDRAVVIGLGLVATILLFVVIPLTQIISGYKDRPQLLRTVDISLPPPPPPPQEPPPPPEEKQQEEKPELEKPQPKLNLSQLEAALNPGTGDALGGTFTFDLAGMAQDDLDRVFELTDLDQPPRAIYQAQPQFPQALSRAGIEGRVIVRCVVDKEGRVHNPVVVSSTRSEFERPALDAIRQWRFEPGVRNGMRVAVRVEVPFKFNL